MNEDDLWLSLVMENNIATLDKLIMVEHNTPGYGTIIVPTEGFSDNDEIHNAVLDWLWARGVNVVNVGILIARMVGALDNF